MRRDEELLLALPGDGVATFRVYEWAPWAISLGRNQDASRHLDLEACAREGIPVVSRPTGGRAVYHAEELTYAIALPAGEGTPAGTGATYAVIADVLVEALRALGVAAASGGERRGGASSRAAACFASTTRHEIAVGSRKIVGSAQRRTAGGLLQHGSILIGPAHARLGRYLRPAMDERLLLGMTTDLGAELRRAVSAEEVARSVRDAAARRWGAPLAETLTP
jgi:lipoate-protein ligase A